MVINKTDKEEYVYSDDNVACVFDRFKMEGCHSVGLYYGCGFVATIFKPAEFARAWRKMKCAEDN